MILIKLNELQVYHSFSMAMYDKSNIKTKYFIWIKYFYWLAEIESICSNHVYVLY